jgi:hypothetical protein
VSLTAQLGSRTTVAAALTPLLALVISARLTNCAAVGFPETDGVRPKVDVLLGAMDRFDIGAGKLPDQLQALFSPRQLIFIYSFRDLETVKGNAVRGQLTLNAALRTMLEGTGCTYKTFDNMLEVSCKARLDLKADAE